MPPLPKPKHLRQRRNKSATSATLQTPESARKNRVPALPKRDGGWHPMVKEWWSSVWRSPMASEYLDADMRGGLFLLAELYQIRWTATEPRAIIEAAKEIRLQGVLFGLSPIDRRRLQWEVERGEQAADKLAARKQTKRAAKKPAADPRSVLKAVS